METGLQSAKRILSSGYLNTIKFHDAELTSNRPKEKINIGRREYDKKPNSVGSGMNMIQSAIDNKKSENRMPSLEDTQKS